MPISLQGNDKFPRFLDFLRANATRAGITPNMVYNGRLEDMSYKLCPVIVREGTLHHSKKPLAIQDVHEILNKLQGSIRGIRRGATGPLRIPLGKLVSIQSKEKEEMSMFLSVRPLPGPETDEFSTILELITNTLFEAGVPPMRLYWAFENPSLNAQRMSNIFAVTASPTREELKGGLLKFFDSEKIFALEGLKDLGLKRSDDSIQLDLGEISVPGIQLLKGATVIGGRRSVEGEVSDDLAALLSYLTENAAVFHLPSPAAISLMDEVSVKVGNVVVKQAPTFLQDGIHALEAEQVQEAMNQLREPIKALRHGQEGPLKIPFGILRPRHPLQHRYNPKRTHVLHLGPSPEQEQFLSSVISTIYTTLRNKKILHLPNRYPPKPHVSLINVRRAPRDDYGFPVPADLTKLYALTELKARFRAGMPFKTSEFESGVQIALGTVMLPELRLEKVTPRGETVIDATLKF
ncbi:hypothetical protein BU17DRAFT_61893 [Hysterangium stoloniferum]|nr:hypothetical protein BU17DRAFT_61893 [Hysterangium stoloniferum]